MLAAIREGGATESARATLERLRRDPRFRGRVLPSERTVQDIVRELTPADPSDPWRLGDATPEEAALILPALGQTMYRDGHVPMLSRAEAEWLVRIRTAVPRVSPRRAFDIAITMHSLDVDPDPEVEELMIASLAAAADPDEKDPHAVTMSIDIAQILARRKEHPDGKA